MIMIRNFFRTTFFEVFVLFVFLFVSNNFTGKDDTVILADGKGYYEYLPSIFIHNDFNRHSLPLESDSVFYGRILNMGSYVDYNGYKVNKYSVGTAVLELPLFLYTLATTKRTGDFNDGYQDDFQNAVYYSALVYLFLGLWFFKKLMRMYHVGTLSIITAQLLIVLGTALTLYAYAHSSYSHVFSFFAITAFLYFSKRYFEENTLRDFLIASLFIGLIFILRQINILIVLLLPFLAGSFPTLKQGVFFVFKHPLYLIGGMALAFSIVSLQMAAWYFQTGDLIVYSYQGEGFDFAKPNMLKFLFSYQKGLFVYHPLLLLGTVSTVWFAFKKRYFELAGWVLFFFLLIFVESSWWVWFYGACFGQRVMIDYYALFFIPFALLLNESRHIVRILLIVLSLLLVDFNIIQTYQYKNYILGWVSMDKEAYWKVFLRTEDKYKGWVIKRTYDMRAFEETEGIDLGDFVVDSATFQEVYSIHSTEINGFENTSLLRISFDHSFSEDDNLSITVAIKNLTKGVIHDYQSKPLLHFANHKPGNMQRGLYDYRYNKAAMGDTLLIKIEVSNSLRSTVLQNLELSFLKLRY